MPGGTLRSQDVTALAPMILELAGGTREFDILLELDHSINLLSDDSLINNLHVMSLISTRDFLISSQMLRTQEFCSSSGKIFGKRTKILKYSHVNDQTEIKWIFLKQKSNLCSKTFEMLYKYTGPTYLAPESQFEIQSEKLKS